MKLNLPVLLSFNAGYVDTMGFLALKGLFTAHVTGNFVMIGDALAHGSAGVVSKLLALPIFCVTIVILQYLVLKIVPSPARALQTMLAAIFLFLAAGAISAIGFGGFSSPDELPLILTGMLLVIAMAVQNAAHRLHLASAPPTTLMTGTTTQIMIDVANLLFGNSMQKADAVRTRLIRLSVTVVSFAFGCGIAALSFIQLGMGCFIFPPLLTLLGMVLYARDKTEI